MNNHSVPVHDEPNITFAIAVDDFSIYERENRYLTVQNVESFYNYRTVGDDFKLASSVLSNENNLIELKVKRGILPRKTYQIVPEIIVRPEDSEISLLNLHLKKDRIKGALSKIKNNTDINNENNSIFFSYFSLPEEAGTSISNEREEIPQYCRAIRISRLKPACIDCKQICAFPMESLLHPVKSISQADILDELENHLHPKSRNIDNADGTSRKRLTNEAALELAHHYAFSHKKSWPEIL